MSLGDKARPDPIWAASWPSRDAQRPSSPWRCSAMASVSNRRTSTMSRYMLLRSTSPSGYSWCSIRSPSGVSSWISSLSCGATVVAPPVSTVTCHSFRGGLALGSPTLPHNVTIYALFALGGYVARVIVDVMLKPEIHDPQGEAVLSASRRLGFGGVTGVRQGKRFEVEIDGPVDGAALAAIEELARELLANPVIEE